MKEKGFFAKLVSPTVWVNLLLMLLFIIAAIWGTLRWIDKYTHHGEIIEVPNVKGLSLAQAEKLLADKHLKAVVVDSGYIRTLAPGSILEQSPVAGRQVKSEREIQLTINSRTTPTIALPDIANNNSYREADAKLRSMGFKVGECEYITGDKHWVYGVKLQGKTINAGYPVPIDLPLTLVVGDGIDPEEENQFGEETDNLETPLYDEDESEYVDF